jgi:hypothetical protein
MAEAEGVVVVRGGAQGFVQTSPVVIGSSRRSVVWWHRPWARSTISHGGTRLLHVHDVVLARTKKWPLKPSSSATHPDLRQGPPDCVVRTTRC